MLTGIRALALAGSLACASAAVAQSASSPVNPSGTIPFDELLLAVLNNRSPTSANAPDRIAAGPWGPVWQAMRAKTAADGLENATIVYALPGWNTQLRLGLVRDVPGTENRVASAQFDEMVRRHAGVPGTRIVAVMHTHPRPLTFSQNDILKAAQSGSVAVLVHARGVELLVGKKLGNTDVGIMMLFARTGWYDQLTCDLARANLYGIAAEPLARRWSGQIVAKAHAAHYTLDPSGTKFVRTSLAALDVDAEFQAYRAGLVDAVRMAVVQRGVDAALAELADGTLSPTIQANLGVGGRNFVVTMAKSIADLDVDGVIKDHGTALSRISVFPMFTRGVGCDGRVFVKVTQPGRPVRGYFVSLSDGTVKIVPR